MYIEYDRITIEGFKTFVGGKTELALTGDLPGVRFVRGRNEADTLLGSNGAAKSSLFDALSWCLFGRTIKSLRNPDIIPWSGKGTPRVSLVLYKDNRRRRITRTASPNQLLIDDKESSQEAVEALIGVNFEVFKHTQLLGQGQPLFFDLSPKEKMDIFSNALNLDRWEARSEAAKAKRGELETESGDLIALLQSTHTTVDHHQKLLKAAEAELETWNEQQKEKAAGVRAEIKEAEAHVAKLGKIVDDADLALDSAGTELKAVERDIKKWVELRDKAAGTHAKAELVLEGLSDVLVALQTELDGLGRGDSCPTCGQSLKGTALAKHRKGLEQRRTELETRVAAGVPKNVVTALETAVTRLAQSTAHAEQFRVRAEEAQARLNMQVPIKAQWSGQLLELKKQLAEEPTNPYRAQVVSHRRELNRLEAEREALQADLDSCNRELERTSYWVRGFKDVRLHLVEEVLQELELATNAMLPESGLEGWEVRYDIERETKKGTTAVGLNVTVLSPRNKKAVRWESWSAGEGHRLLVVGALALAEVLLSHAGVNTNLEILDEPTNHLSDEGVHDLCEYLADRAKRHDKDIWFIDHRAVEGAYFVDTITVVKDKGGHSYVAE